MIPVKLFAIFLVVAVFSSIMCGIIWNQAGISGAYFDATRWGFLVMSIIFGLAALNEATGERFVNLSPGVAIRNAAAMGQQMTGQYVSM